MILELKKISFSEALSDDSSAFAAEVFIDGVKRATAQNSGHGGPTSVDAYAKLRQSPEGDKAYSTERKANRAVLDQYEAWAKTQPEIETDLPTEGGGTFSYARSLEHDVDNLLEEWLKAKDAQRAEARIKRMCSKNWVFSLTEKDGKPCDPNTVYTIPRQSHQTLAVLKKHLTEKYGAALKDFLNERYS